MAYSDPTVTVNNTPHAIVPNSFKFTEGYGEVNVRAASVGGGSVEPISTEDSETKIGKISFDMYVTQEARDLVSECKNLTGANVVSGTQTGEKAITMTLASLVNDPEFEATADGKVSLEFEGAPLSRN